MGTALESIRDATGRADIDRVRSAFAAVEAAYARQGNGPRWPVSIVVERMPIMGATQSRRDGGHLVHISLHAVESGMLDGLIAHEMGHIARTEARHPSHNKRVHDRALAQVPVPRAFRRGFPRLARAAIGHVEDIYADDLAIPLVVADRSRPFFAEWVRNAMTMAGSPWDEVLAALDIAFSLGNLERHHLLPANDPLRREAMEFADRRGVRSMKDLIAVYRDLPDPVTDEACVDLLAGLLGTELDELRNRPG